MKCLHLSFQRTYSRNRAAVSAYLPVEAEKESSQSANPSLPGVPSLPGKSGADEGSRDWGTGDDPVVFAGDETS